jgi:hypothetical protein
VAVVTPAGTADMTALAWVGLAVMVVSQGATIAGIEPFATWNTPVCWTGFIVFADEAVHQLRPDRRSYIRSAPAEFVFLCLMSIPLWLVFEWFNLFIQNWRYVGLPENPALRTIGYGWSFATILPALFEGSDLFAALRERSARRAGRAPTGPRIRLPHTPFLSAACALAGAAMLVWPVVSPSPYLAAPVWLGFILLLAPINRAIGADTLIVNGSGERLMNLVWSGFLCGILWEFWNFWAHAKWHYTVPIMEHLKMFEMPVPGYLGFPAFAVECFTMYVFTRAMLARIVPAVARFRYRIALSSIIPPSTVRTA